MSTIVAPSLLAADFLNLGRDIEMLNRSEADWIHLDIMDGVFVPNISFGFAVTNLLKKVAKKPLDTHLMIVEPEKFIKEVAATGSTYMNVHFETCNHLHRVVQQIRDRHGSLQSRLILTHRFLYLKILLKTWIWFFLCRSTPVSEVRYLLTTH